MQHSLALQLWKPLIIEDLQLLMGTHSTTPDNSPVKRAPVLCNTNISSSHYPHIRSAARPPNDAVRGATLRSCAHRPISLTLQTATPARGRCCFMPPCQYHYKCLPQKAIVLACAYQKQAREACMAPNQQYRHRQTKLKYIRRTVHHVLPGWGCNPGQLVRNSLGNHVVFAIFKFQTFMA